VTVGRHRGFGNCDRTVAFASVRLPPNLAPTEITTSPTRNGRRRRRARARGRWWRRARRAPCWGTSLLIIPHTVLDPPSPSISPDPVLQSESRSASPLKCCPIWGNPPAQGASGGVAPPVIDVLSYLRTPATAPMPPQPGHPFSASRSAVGDPRSNSIERGTKAACFSNGAHGPVSRAELSEHEALVMSLQLKNLSKDTEFRPMDLAFDHLLEGRAESPQCPGCRNTHLELSNGKALLAGPSSGSGRPPARPASADEYVEGQEEHMAGRCCPARR